MGSVLRVGDLAPITVEFAIGGERVDPTAVVLIVRPPVGEAFSPAVARVDVGSYRAEVPVTVPGMWRYRWQGTGSVVAINEGAFTVLASGLDAPPLPPWAPSPTEVAALVPAYTRGGFDDDEPAAGAEHGAFTAATSPALEHVWTLIGLSAAAVQGAVGPTPIPPRCHDLARSVVALRVAREIALGKTPADSDDINGEHRARAAAYDAELAELQRQARQPTALRLGC